ncbi:dienelactone hydrolase [Luteibacter sp. Sphag1AF]|uniref:dienelactone hydrolase n=1 Tax=Luteibacter sp. Sphag1AF TaxID=2587031 RepID=UPI00161D4D76|nr:dienelactone hydrolase [Luteibacter sp. Sphag1AF]MBB3228212.1 dienelactone hydrolase [Luteibacter sp. Sphag1AF]
MKLLGRWCLSIALSLSAIPLRAQTPSFQFLEPAGPSSVGLKVVNQYDTSRSYPLSADNGTKNGHRPIQTLIWYPAQPAAGKAMTVGDYASLADTENFDHPRPEKNKWRAQLQSSSEVQLWAHKDASPAPGRYPVLVYAPSDSSTPWENADLCEYLASHGYVVLASPSMGAATRDMTDDLRGIDAQARDISFLITYAKTLPNADMSRVGLVSWSWGGISSLFAAARDPRVKALAEMDGSMRYFPGIVQKAGDIHPDRMTIPLLFFTAEYPNLLEDLEAGYKGPQADRMGPNVLNAWTHGDLYTVNMVGMSHGQFGAMQQRRKSAESFAADQVADYGRDDANTSHAWVARYILNFLDATLKKDDDAAAFLLRTPAQNGVPRHFMATKFRPAETKTVAQPWPSRPMPDQSQAPAVSPSGR